MIEPRILRYQGNNALPVSLRPGVCVSASYTVMELSPQATALCPDFVNIMSGCSQSHHSHQQLPTETPLPAARRCRAGVAVLPRRPCRSHRVREHGARLQSQLRLLPAGRRERRSAALGAHVRLAVQPAGQNRLDPSM